MAVLRLPLGIELDLILPTRYWNYSYNPQSKTGTLDFRWVLGSSFLKDHTSISHTGMKIDLVWDLDAVRLLFLSWCASENVEIFLLDLQQRQPSYSKEKNKSEASPNSQIAMRHVYTSVQLIQRWWTSELHTEDCFDSEARDTILLRFNPQWLPPLCGSTVDLETSSTLKFTFWWLLS